MRSDEDIMRLALSALEDSRDIVWTEYTNDWRHGLPTRKAQLEGLRIQAEEHDAAIEALRQRLVLRA